MIESTKSAMPISYLDQNLYVCDHGVGLEVVHRPTSEGAFLPNEMGASEIREQMADFQSDPSLMADFIKARISGLFNKVSTQ